MNHIPVNHVARWDSTSTIGMSQIGFFGRNIRMLLFWSTKIISNVQLTQWRKICWESTYFGQSNFLKMVNLILGKRVIVQPDWRVVVNGFLFDRANDQERMVAHISTVERSREPQLKFKVFKIQFSNRPYSLCMRSVSVLVAVPHRTVLQPYRSGSTLNVTLPEPCRFETESRLRYGAARYRYRHT